LAGCSEDGGTLIAPSARLSRTVAAPEVIPFSPRQKVDPDRKDNKWRRMDDEAFGLAVERAKGRVSIGFKNVGAVEGVDATGRRLMSKESATAAVASIVAQGAKVRYQFQGQPAVLATIDREMAVRLRKDANVDYVEPETFMSLSSQVTPWGITATGAPSAWSLSTGGSVKVLVIDTGHDTTATDLNYAVRFRCDTSLDPRQYDWTGGGHGTIMAGIIAALDNSADVIGMAPDVSLWSANISYDWWNGVAWERRVSADDAACAVDVANINNIREVNMSWGAPGGSNTALTNAINDGYNNHNVLFVAAAGNDTGSVHYPANLANVIAVGAIDDVDAHAPFSNTGSALDISAPGVGILSTWMSNGNPGDCTVSSGGKTITCNGTSSAAAHVSGAAALLFGRYPSWTNAQVRNRLLSTATDLGSAGFDNTYGYGKLDVNAAMRMTTVVTGVSPAYSGTEYEYGAVINGGQSPFAYEWFVDGNPVSTASSLLYTPGSTDFSISVIVTDYFGLQAFGGKSVTVIECGAPPLDPCT
jgi:hypothetical protein